MGETSNIAWTDATWNCIIGCSHVSPVCEHCYAETLATRYGWTKKPWGAQHAAENVQLRPKRLTEPLKWKQPKRVFVNSLSDLFHEQVPFEYIDQVFAVMKMAYWHTFQVLTKRPDRMLDYFSDRAGRQAPHLRVAFACHELSKPSKGMILANAIRHYAELDYDPEDYIESGEFVAMWPLPNVWLGVSVEDQRRADERIPLLLQTPAAVRFLSCEPLLGPVDLSAINPLPERFRDPLDSHVRLNALTGHVAGPDEMIGAHVSWVIAGGESGPKHRPMDLDWARSLRDQCVSAGVSFFYKQSSGPRPGMNPTLDGVEWHQFPKVAGG